LALLASCDVVMPVPSSLWGRLHGRLDLAYLLADTLRKHSGRSLVLPPRRLSWRWKKQTWIKRSQRRAHEYKQKNQYDAGFFASKALAIPNDRRLRVLIRADVVTTANTLTDLADQFRNIDFQFFTLASAYRPNRTQRSGIEGCEIC
ncbi:MAG: hypothetical protein NTX25_16195, partial [Proteobacteria bacterium]|nr:hypothetical protein [Pseudomonadota bacterium]